MCRVSHKGLGGNKRVVQMSKPALTHVWDILDLAHMGIQGVLEPYDWDESAKRLMPLSNAIKTEYTLAEINALYRPGPMHSKPLRCEQYGGSGSCERWATEQCSCFGGWAS